MYNFAKTLDSHFVQSKFENQWKGRPRLRARRWCSQLRRSGVTPTCTRHREAGAELMSGPNRVLSECSQPRCAS